MNKVLSPDQVKKYHRQGFVSPLDLLTADEVNRYRGKLEAAERQYPEQLNAENRNNPHLVFPFLDELVHHPVILDAVEDLIGTEFSVWGSVFFIKEGHSEHYVSWHQDATYMGIIPHNFVSAWIALSESNAESGCMSMIPGSHLDPIHPHEDTFDDDNILTRGQAISAVDESQAVDLILRPGQMSLHHARVIHGSRPNRSPHRRIGFVIQGYMPKGARQVLGKNYWLPMRGECNQSDFVSLHRPGYDMDPDGLLERTRVNRNWADILYQGASRKRTF